MKRKDIQKQDSLEKLLFYALGCQPDEFGLYPNSEGFVPFKELLAALKDEEGWRGLRESQVLRLIDEPGRVSGLELRDSLIRLKPELGRLPPQPPDSKNPPKWLYAALKPAAWAVVSERGLGPKSGSGPVRLWTDPEQALRIARRQGPEPVLVRIAVPKALSAGTLFSPYTERLWLCGFVPRAALFGPPVPPRPEEKEAGRENPKGRPDHLEETREKTGSFYPPGPEPALHQGKQKGKYSDSPDWKNQIRRERRRRQNEPR